MLRLLACGEINKKFNSSYVFTTMDFQPLMPDRHVLSVEANSFNATSHSSTRTHNFVFFLSFISRLFYKKLTNSFLHAKITLLEDFKAHISNKKLKMNH